jgi:hypothetical protein
MERILLKNRVEALGMLLEEFDAEKYERTLRSEGREEGEERVNRLGILLTEVGFAPDVRQGFQIKLPIFISFYLMQSK